MRSVSELLWGSATHSLLGEKLLSVEFPWKILGNLAEEIVRLGRSLDGSFREREPGVWIAEDATVAPSATFLPPTVIGHKTEIRPGAFLRGGVLVGDGCVIGNSTELKNCILFDGVQVPHYNYVGDSVLGFHAHLGAGAVISNVKGDKSEVVVRLPWESYPSGRKKVGAFLGDYAEIGCNSVLNPGSVIGRNARIYPLTNFRGYLPENRLRKSDGETVSISISEIPH